MAHVTMTWGWMGSQGRNALRTAILGAPKSHGEQPNVPHASERVTEMTLERGGTLSCMSRKIKELWRIQERRTEQREDAVCIDNSVSQTLRRRH